MPGEDSTVNDDLGETAAQAAQNALKQMDDPQTTALWQERCAMPADTINRQLRGSFYRGNRLAFALAAAGVLMGAVLNLIISWLMQQLIDTAAGTSGGTAFPHPCPGLRWVLPFCFSAVRHLSTAPSRAFWPRLWSSTKTAP